MGQSDLSFIPFLPHRPSCCQYASLDERGAGNWIPTLRMSFWYNNSLRGVPFSINNQKLKLRQGSNWRFVLPVYLLNFVPRKRTHSSPWVCSVLRCVLRFPIPWKEAFQAAFSFFPYSICCCLLFRRKSPRPQTLTPGAVCQVNTVAALGDRAIVYPSVNLPFIGFIPLLRLFPEKLERIRDSTQIIKLSTTIHKKVYLSCSHVIEKNHRLGYHNDVYWITFKPIPVPTRSDGMSKARYNKFRFILLRVVVPSPFIL